MPKALIYMHPLRFDYQADLENGALDLVIGSSAMRHEHFRLYPLLIVCLVRQGHPVLRAGLTPEADHLG